VRAFAEAWSNAEIVQQLVGRLPWGHNLVLLTKLKEEAVRRQYAQRAIEQGWSRNVLAMQIDARALAREGRAVTNFVAALPEPQSDLAHNTLKDPYLFDFLSIGLEADERAIESALVQHISRFLLELGAGFAFVGRQVHLGSGWRRLLHRLALLPSQAPVLCRRGAEGRRLQARARRARHFRPSCKPACPAWSRSSVNLACATTTHPTKRRDARP